MLRKFCHAYSLACCRAVCLACCVAVIGGLLTMMVPDVADAGPSTRCLPASLKARLSQIRSRWGAVRVVSTHRRGARIAGSGRRSFHASCRAVDFHPPRGKYRAVVAWLKANHKGGVGTYSCGMHHVHLDNGPRIRFHHCVTARGRPIKSRSRSASRSRKRRVVRQRAQRKSVSQRSAAAYTRIETNRYNARLQRNGA